MGVDDAKRRRFVMQIGENTHQHDVLDDVGKAAGMKGVTVVHAGGVTTSGGESNPRHSGAMRSIEPGISRFPDVQLHIRGLVLAHHPGMTSSLSRLVSAASPPGRAGRRGGPFPPERCLNGPR